VYRTFETTHVKLYNLTEGTTVFGVMVDTCLKTFGKDDILLQFVKRVFT